MTKRLSVLCSFSTALAFCAGCGETADGSEVDMTSEVTVRAFSEAACATAATDKFLHNWTPGRTEVGMTPTTYSNPNCYKSFLFDLGNLPTAYPGEIEPAYSIGVQWTDPWPRTKAQCATTLGMQFYGSGGYTFGPFTVESKWENGACNLGVMGISTYAGLYGGYLFINSQGQLAPNLGGYPIRLAVTARTAANSTQSVKVTYRVGANSPPPPPCPEC